MLSELFHQKMKNNPADKSSHENDNLLKNWNTPGQTAYDFRSDYVTTPTAEMLNSIINTTLGDDVLQEDATTNSFQEWIAELTGHEAALLVCTGTMGNQVALRTALMTPPYSILTDHRSHILRMEGGGAATICSALIEGVVPLNGHHLTLEDVKKHAVIKPDLCKWNDFEVERDTNFSLRRLSNQSNQPGKHPLRNHYAP